MENDVVELILADHRRFEDLLREVRNAEADREGALAELSAILVAHARPRRKRSTPRCEIGLTR